ncbi:S8 family serine peptidase [Actinomadura sp. DC4]|uniref:S8 family serine peptidase n=1 Tax=Actinomadura sp. DC4 TaxID=3055069 RepID=UPI0025B23AE7|nr:S8 family serine peptidase [Actinomadura sp. DC4]MDN3354801.1 S8 family serine peptidase [Actinomadura sp. DC4]
MRRVPRRLHAVASVAAATASLLVSAVPGAASAAAYERSEAAPGPVGLPVMPSVLAPGQHCTDASPTQAHAQPWTVRALSLSRVRQLSEGAGVTVAVVDTGVGADVPAMAGRVTAAGDAGRDCVGHGSFVAGLIAGRADDATGGGVAPQARILAVRGTDPRGITTPGRVAAAIHTAVDRGARVIYVAAALTIGRDELTAAVAYATAKDVLVVAPAVPDAVPATTGTGTTGTGTTGTTGTGTGGTTGGGAAIAQPYFPAFIPQVVSVMDFGADGSRPKDAPPVFNTDLAAPGDAMVSVGPKGTGHFIGSGSSLAAACVAGTAALVRAYQPQLTAAEVAKRLVASAYPAAKPILDPYAAVAAVSSTAGSPPRPEGAVRMPDRASEGPRHRALIIASVGGGLVALVAAAAVVIPLGRARRWRPAGRSE